MPIRTEFKITIDRPAEEVWNFMFDLKNVPKWDPGVVEARQTSAGPLERVGATIQTFSEGGRDRGTARVAEFEMYRKLVLTFVEEAKGPLRQAKLTYTFEPDGNHTTLTRVVEAEIVGFWKLIQPYISYLVNKDSRAEAANIRALFPPRS